MEDLPLGKNCSLSAWVCSEGPALGQNTDDDDDDVYGMRITQENRSMKKEIYKHLWVIPGFWNIRYGIHKLM